MSTRYGRALLASLALATAGAASACSVATAAMKSQIASQRGGIGRKGCPEIDDGAIAYAGGEQSEGEAKLRQAAARNSPDQVQRFTKALAPLVEAADADTAKKLRAVIAIVEGGASTSTPAQAPSADVAVAENAAAQAKAAAKSEATGSGAMSIARPEIDNLRAGMVNPGTDTQLLPCDPTMSDAKTCGRVRVVLGPFVLTNVYASGGCAQDLFVSSADSEGAVDDARDGRRPAEPVRPLPRRRRSVALHRCARKRADEERSPLCGRWSGFRPTEKPVATPYSPFTDGE